MTDPSVRPHAVGPRPRNVVVDAQRRYGLPATQVLDMLRAQRGAAGVTADGIGAAAAAIGIPQAHLAGTASFFDDLAAPTARRHVRVCAGTACFAATGGRHIAAVEDALGVRCGEAAPDGSVSLQACHCLGHCYGGPAALDGDEPRAGADLPEQLTGAARPAPPIPFAALVEDPVVFAGLVGGEPAWQAWPAALRDHPGAVLAEVVASGLRGRGGAGFAAGRKWQLALGHGEPVVVANGDEGDPGSYVDRLLMESDPGRVLEGLALCALAVGARRGIVYVRSEYPRARDALRAAVAEAVAAGHLGHDLHGTGRTVEIEVFEGAGSYVAGEETSLIRSLEGLRGGVVARPPYPVESGFLGGPTIVNNVETLASVPWIVARGGAAYAARGTPSDPGTKVVCLNERFARPGAYEVELGCSLRWLVEEVGGGLRDGARLAAIEVGGPLGGFLAADQLDLPLETVALEQAGAALGHASIVAVDTTTPPLDLLAHVWDFGRSESCGTCSPCRIGTQRGHELAQRAKAAGALSPSDASEQDDLCTTLTAASLCAFGPGVAQAVRSVVRAYGGRLEGGT